MLYSDRIHETGRFTYMHLRSYQVVFWYMIYTYLTYLLFMINEGKQDMYFSTMFFHFLNFTNAYKIHVWYIDPDLL